MQQGAAQGRHGLDARSTHAAQDQAEGRGQVGGRQGHGEQAGGARRGGRHLAASPRSQDRLRIQEDEGDTWNCQDRHVARGPFNERAQLGLLMARREATGQRLDDRQGEGGHLQDSGDARAEVVDSRHGQSRPERQRQARNMRAQNLGGPHDLDTQSERQQLAPLGATRQERYDTQARHQTVRRDRFGERGRAAPEEGVHRHPLHAPAGAQRHGGAASFQHRGGGADPSEPIQPLRSRHHAPVGRQHGAQHHRGEGAAEDGARLGRQRAAGYDDAERARADQEGAGGDQRRQGDVETDARPQCAVQSRGVGEGDGSGREAGV